MKEFTVGKNDAGQRLDRFVGKTAPMLPASLLQKYIRQKDVKVNGRPAKGDVRLSEGDTVRLYIPDEFFDRPGKDDAWRAVAAPKVDVVYEDENILLVNKRPGMLCHSAGEWTWDTLIAHIQAYLRAKGEWDPTAENSFAPALCNRIDRNTGGIVIAAKTAEALRIMDEKVRAREMEKTYLCAVLGTPKPSAGRLEGYLFPDTYEFYVDDDPERVINRLLSNFEDKFSDEMIEAISARNEDIRSRMEEEGTFSEEEIEAAMMDMGKIVTLASLIEKEAGSESERPLIASVIYNRLTTHVHELLQVDATVEYVLGEDHEGPLTEADLEVESPYNTYLNKGLPPGPIANPGLASLMAAIYPKDTDFFFYALSEDGDHEFFETYMDQQDYLMGIITEAPEPEPEPEPTPAPEEQQDEEEEGFEQIPVDGEEPEDGE